MGSPETKKKRRFPHLSAIPQLPSIAEKIKLLTFGSRMKPVVNPENLLAILDRIKEVLLPMVRWFDKPISELSGFTRGIPEKLQKKRAMLVHNGYGHGTFTLALDRSGSWFVELFGDKDKRYS